MSYKDSRTIYSTDPNFKLCPRCESYPCRCRKVKSLPAKEQSISLYRERKGRGGKTVTVIRGLVLSDEDMKSLTRHLKQACGTGGTVKENEIEIQGEHRGKISVLLHAMGYKTKIVGG